MGNFLSIKSILEGGSLEEMMDGNREEEDPREFVSIFLYSLPFSIIDKRKKKKGTSQHFQES